MLVCVVGRIANDWLELSACDRYVMPHGLAGNSRVGYHCISDTFVYTEVSARHRLIGNDFLVSCGMVPLYRNRRQATVPNPVDDMGKKPFG